MHKILLKLHEHWMRAVPGDQSCNSSYGCFNASPFHSFEQRSIISTIPWRQTHIHQDCIDFNFQHVFIKTFGTKYAYN